MEPADTVGQSRKPSIPPQQRAQALGRVHRGVARLHGIAVVVWLVGAGSSGALTLVGVAVPPLVPIGCLIAALAHGILLLVHYALAHRARRQAAGTTSPQAKRL